MNTKTMMHHNLELHEKTGENMSPCCWHGTELWTLYLYLYLYLAGGEDVKRRRPADRVSRCCEGAAAAPGETGESVPARLNEASNQ